MSWKQRVMFAVGDIAASETEAVVNAANNELWMGGGVAGALKRAGGTSIEREAVALGPIAVGDSVITRAGELPTLYVIHAAVMAPGRAATSDAVRAATASALTLAAENRIESITMPALGTGVGGLAFNECAQMMLDAIREHCAAHAMPGEILFMLSNLRAQQVFEEQFRSAPD